jgi:hypothetical protein
MAFAMAAISAGSAGRSWSGPGTQGTPACRIARFAATLSPMIRMQAALGPTKTSPAASTLAANSAFSDRKP